MCFSNPGVNVSLSRQQINVPASPQVHLSSPPLFLRLFTSVCPTLFKTLEWLVKGPPASLLSSTLPLFSLSSPGLKIGQLIIKQSRRASSSPWRSIIVRSGVETATPTDISAHQVPSNSLQDLLLVSTCVAFPV